MGVNLHAGDEVGPPSGRANRVSKPTTSFAQFKIELEGLSWKLSLFFLKSGRKCRAIYGT